MTTLLTHLRFRLAQEPEQIRKLGKQISGPLEIMSDETATDYERAAAKDVLRRNIGRFEEARALAHKTAKQTLEPIKGEQDVVG